MRAFHRVFGRLVGGRQLDTVVECHCDVGAECFLHVGRDFRCQALGAAVDVRPEGHSIFGYLPEVGEGEDLEPAGVGQDWPLPLHEAVQSAEPGDPFVPGAEEEVVGV